MGKDFYGFMSTPTIEYIAEFYYNRIKNYSEDEVINLLVKYIENFLKNYRQIQPLKIKWLQQFLEISLPQLRYYKRETKIQNALNQLEIYPVDIQNDKLERLARVPGISIVSAKRLFLLRQMRKIDYIDISKCNGRLFIAKHFICLNNKLPKPFLLRSKKQNKIQQFELF